MNSGYGLPSDKRLKRISQDNRVPWGMFIMLIGTVVVGLGLMYGILMYRPIPWVASNCVQLDGWRGFGMADHYSVWSCRKIGAFVARMHCVPLDDGSYICAMLFRSGLGGRRYYADDRWVSRARRLSYCIDYSVGYEGVVVPCGAPVSSRGPSSLSGYAVVLGLVVFLLLRLVRFFRGLVVKAAVAVRQSARGSP
jgi:hypothetical protein